MLGFGLEESSGSKDWKPVVLMDLRYKKITQSGSSEIVSYAMEIIRACTLAITLREESIAHVHL